MTSTKTAFFPFVKIPTVSNLPQNTWPVCSTNSILDLKLFRISLAGCQHAVSLRKRLSLLCPNSHESIKTYIHFQIPNRLTKGPLETNTRN